MAHIRIEFDSIKDVPRVWIDGQSISQLPDAALVDLQLEYHTSDASKPSISTLSADWWTASDNKPEYHHYTERNHAKG